MADSLTDGEQRDSHGGGLDPGEGEELADLLAALGVDERPSRILGFLAVERNGRSSEIEDALGMRQPEVSQATKALRDRGWVVAYPEKTPGKGRPVNNYHLKAPLADIVNEIEAERRERINEELTRIDRLRSLVERREPMLSEREPASEAERPPERLS